MREGWRGNDYLILFADSETNSASARYDISDSLPGHAVVGLRGWDDLIVRDPQGNTFSVPAVPLISDHLSPFSVPTPDSLEKDQRFEGKIKWYVKPVVFGGDPESEDNIAWLDHEAHGKAVRWWNQLYRDLKAKQNL